MSRSSARVSKISDFYGSHTDPITCASLGRLSHRVLATGSTDNTINVFRISKSKPLMLFGDNTTPITTLRFDYNETLLCSGNRGGTVKVYDCNSGKQKNTFTGHKTSISCIDWYPVNNDQTNASLLCSGGSDASIRLWDLRKNGCAQSIVDKLDISSITALKFSPDGKWLIAGNSIGVIKVYDLTTQKILHNFSPCNSISNGSNNTIVHIECHPVEVIMACCTNTQCYLYDMDTLELLGVTPLDKNIRYICFSEFSSDTVIICTDQHVKIWNYCNNNTQCVLLDYIDVNVFNKSILTDISINEVDITQKYEITGVTRTDTNIGIYSVDLTNTEYYRLIQQQNNNSMSVDSIDVVKQYDNKPNNNINTKQPLQPIINNTNNNNNNSPNRVVKRAVDQPNTAFFDQKFDNVSNNINVTRNDSIGAVVLSPAQPNNQQQLLHNNSRPNTNQSTINNINSSRPTTTNTNGGHTHIHASQPLPIQSRPTSSSQLQHQHQHHNNNNKLDFESKENNNNDTVMSTAHSHNAISPSATQLSETGRHVSVGVGQTLPPIQQHHNNISANNSNNSQHHTFDLPAPRYANNTSATTTTATQQQQSTPPTNVAEQPTTTASQSQSQSSLRPVSSTTRSVSQPTATTQSSSQQSDICQSLLSAHAIVNNTLTPRLAILRSLRKSWLLGDITTVLTELNQCNDFIAIHSFLQSTDTILKNNILNLDYCIELVSVLSKMLSSPIPQPISTALQYMQWICIQYNDLLKASLTYKPNDNMIDISYEERINKSMECYRRLKHIYPRLPALSQREQPIGLLAKDFRNRLDMLIAIEKKNNGR